MFDYLQERQWSVIGGFMIQPEARSMITARLSPLFFKDRACRVAFKALTEMHEDGEEIDHYRLHNKLKSQGHVPSPCGPEFSVFVAQQCIGPTDLEISVDKLTEWATKNRIEQIADEMENVQSSDIDEMIDDTQRKLDEARQFMDTSSGVVHISDAMQEMIESIEEGEVGSIEYPIRDLQQLTCGMQQQDYVVIGARPSVGKSSLLRQICFSAADDGESVLLVSAEMSDRGMAQCYIQTETGISMQQVMKGAVSDEKKKEVEQAKRKFEKLDLYVDPCKETGIMDIKSRAELHHKEQGVDLIAVDYLQVISASAESRVDEVSKITRNLKQLTKTLEVPVVAASQLNRSTEGQPKLRHLKWSGAIEQDADQVLLLHRPDKNNQTDEDEAEIVVAKNRMGPTAVIDCVWLPKKMRFADRASVPIT